MAIIGEDSAGATVLTDESVRRRRVGMATGASEDGALKLVSNLHYLRTALAANAELTEGDISSPPPLESRRDVPRRYRKTDGSGA